MIITISACLRASTARSVARLDRGQPTGPIIVRWLLRRATRLGLAIGPITVSWSDTESDDFIRNRQTWRAVAELR